MELFRMQVRNAVWLLEAHGKESSSAAASATEPWGLVSLFGPKQQQRITPQMFFTKRMLNVKDIFDEVPVEELPTTTQYRNTAVKNQITAIQRAAKAEIHKLSTGGSRVEARTASTSLEGTGVKLKRNTKRR
uniref:Uncharacterized protein n=1 Tax=Anopheles maculatus TaxID=74869 RepID=A0A182SRJ4_9DIPT